MRNIYEKFCPNLYHICYDPIGTHKIIRATVGFLFGLSLALIFYVTIIIGLELNPYTTVALGTIICTMVSVGCASSIQVRCVCLLTIPAFLGRAGRSLLKALVLGYVIAGPIFNLAYNGKEVVHTFACTTQLTYNLTKTRWDLMVQPFQQAILGMKKNENDMRDTVASVKDLMAPIVEEMEGPSELKKLNEENDYADDIHNRLKRTDNIQRDGEDQVSTESLGDFYETKYRARIEARCKDQLSKGSDRCRAIFNDMYDKCYESVTWFAAWLLCWPMKLTFICNTVQAFGGSNMCDSKDNIDAGIGDGYASLKGMRSKLSGGLKDARIQYKVNVLPSDLNVQEAGDTAQAILHEFNERHEIFDSCMLLLKRILALVFLKIIYNAQHYHDGYLTDIEYDNHYITPYFRKIDARRRARGSMNILPLKKLERTVLMDLYSVIPSTWEKKYLLVQTTKLFLEIFTTTTIILIDRLFFETLDLVRKHGYIEYTQAGHHDLKLNIRGTGIVATLITNLIRNFNLKKRIKTIVSNGECLPLPKKLSNYVCIKIYGTYLAIWLMLILASYTRRLRRKICTFFYVKREKRRTLYLYNETLRRRVGYLRFMKNKIKELVRQRRLEHNMNLWTELTIDSPFWFGWLRFFTCARQKCLICGESESRKKSNFHTCSILGCSFKYCPECWRDVGNICLACSELSQSDTDSTNEDYDI